MATVKVHFDGRVFVPDSPIDLPVGYTVEVPIPSDEEQNSEPRPLLELMKKLEQMPVNPDWPEDGAQNVDHYLYGAPKQQ